RPVRSLPPGKPRTGPASPRRSVCAPGTVAALMITQTALQRGDCPMFRTSWLARARARRPRRKPASPFRLEVLECPKLPTFSSIPSYAVGVAPTGGRLGDFNNDTRLDLAVLSYAGNSVSVLLGNPDGTFGPAVNANTGTGPVSLAVGDFNGDGKLDIATANYL